MRDAEAGGKLRTPGAFARLALALTSALLVTGFASNAHAYCRTTTCDPDVDCIWDNRTGCPIVGLPLYWPTECVSFTVQERGSLARDIGAGTVDGLARRAFEKWLSVDCGGASPSLQVADFGRSSCGEPEYNQTAPNSNVILFRDTDWPYEDIFSTLAFTTVTFNTETGEIYDADIEMNSFAVKFTTGNDDVQYDLPSVLTHEIGHFLGLDHSYVDGATMDPQYDYGTTWARSLSRDEESGICAIYPADRETTSRDCIPRHGFSRVCEAETNRGCGVNRAGSRAAGGWLAVLALGLVRPLRRRRRRARA